jgi:AI-2 transport protein TqsA
MSEPGVRRAVPLWLTVVLGVAGSAVALWGIHAAASVLGPVVLAFVLTVVAYPLIGALVRHRVRRGIAVAVAVLVVDGGLIAFAIAIILSIGQLATVLPEYSDEWQQLLDQLSSALGRAGVGPEQVQQALHSVEPATVFSALGAVLSSAASWAGALVLLLATVLFMTAEATGVPERLAEVPGTSQLRAALGDFARNTRRYMVVTAVFGFVVAVLDTIALVVLGIPLPLLWGLLAFLTNFVPNIGFILGLVPPTLLGLLVGGPGTALLVVLIYTVVNFVLQSVIQPVFVGDAVGLSVTVSFLSVFVWTVVLGPLGAVLAVPLTLFVYTVLVGQDPGRRWARALLAGASGAERAKSRPATGRRRRPRNGGSAVPPPRVPADGEAGEPDGRHEVGPEDEHDQGLLATRGDGGEGHTDQ